MSVWKRIGWLLALVILTGCSDSNTPGSSARSNNADKGANAGLATETLFIAVNAPLQYFTQRLVGDRVRVEMPVPTGIDPANWQPSLDEVLRLQQADLLIFNGAGYSPWRSRVSIDPNKQVVSAVPFRKRWIPFQKNLTHSHGLEGEHSHSGYAFTTWMDPQLAIQQAQAIADAIQHKLPHLGSMVESRLPDLIANLEALDRGYAGVIAQLRGVPLIFSHPVYQYFQARYQIDGRSVHWEPEQAPSQQQLDTLATQLQALPAKAMIWEGQPLAESVAKLKVLGLESIVVAPQAHAGQGGDWLTVQQQNILALGDLAQRLQSNPTKQGKL